jgi:hypothetical protein
VNLKLNIQLIKNMGMRYTLYRIRHEWERRSGALLKRHPANPPAKHFLSLAQWRALPAPFDQMATIASKLEPEQNELLAQKAQLILNGSIQYFSKEWKNIGLDYDWITNPENGYRYDTNKHWSQIADLSEAAGDIKFVWEKSRFTFLHTLIRYDFHFKQDLSEFVLSQIESWIDANPVNLGPNWRCSQEISLRIFNWLFALSYYKDSPALTEDRWNKIQNVIYWSLHHVYHHIDFSRIAVRNNHAITETLLLTLSDCLFPYIPETKKWAEDGKKWFETEIDYQIYDDGTFLQFSMNYHRVVIQLLSLGFAVFEHNGRQFSPVIYEKAYKSLNFLYQCLQTENGWLPNYGSNDGALFFSWADTDYRDYRPQLNTLHFALTGKDLFSASLFTEDRVLMGLRAVSVFKFETLAHNLGTSSFPVGGFYLCRKQDCFTLIRCGNHKDRPAQADNLHIDIWYKGINVLRDSGTYKYNTDKEKLDYFMGSAGHNTVMADQHSQMLKGGRFIWYYWTQCLSAGWTETEDAYVFEGKIEAFRQLNPKACHTRKIAIAKNTLNWLVRDTVEGLSGFTLKQIWHPGGKDIKISADTPAQKMQSYNSDYYGIIEDTQSIYFEFNTTKQTEINL